MMGKMDATNGLLQQSTRPIVTLLLTVTFCAGFLLGTISGETFGNIVISVTAFWFAQRQQDARATDRAAPPNGGASPSS